MTITPAEPGTQLIITTAEFADGDESHPHFPRHKMRIATLAVIAWHHYDNGTANAITHDGHSQPSEFDDWSMFDGSDFWGVQQHGFRRVTILGPGADWHERTDEELSIVWRQMSDHAERWTAYLQNMAPMSTADRRRAATGQTGHSRPPRQEHPAACSTTPATTGDTAPPAKA